MITYSLWLYEVDASHLANFGTAFREGGIVYESLGRIPGHIHTDLLGGTTNPPGYCQLLSISFFTSIESLLCAQQSAQMRTFVLWLHEQTARSIHIGTFSLLHNSDAEIPSVKIAGHAGTEITPREVPR